MYLYNLIFIVNVPNFLFRGIYSFTSHNLKIVSFTDKNALTSLAASTNGDIRAAINAFQIGCATKQYRKQVFEGSTSLQSSKKKSKNSSQNTTGSSLAVIGGKNVNLDLFHAIGRSNI